MSLEFSWSLQRSCCILQSEEIVRAALVARTRDAPRSRGDIVCSWLPLKTALLDGCAEVTSYAWDQHARPTLPERESLCGMVVDHTRNRYRLSARVSGAASSPGRLGAISKRGVWGTERFCPRWVVVERRRHTR
jgi:hypothetical protein